MEPEKLSPVPPGCEACPNRAIATSSATERGRWAVYIVALTFCGLIVALCFKRDHNGWLHPNPEPPLGVLSLLMTGTGLCLGINIPGIKV